MSDPVSGLEQNIRQRGERIFNSLDEDSGSIFNKDWWYGRIMDWSMKNEHFKTQMFRFVDVLPYLQSSSEVARHLKEYFADAGEDMPSVFNFGLGIGSLAPGILAGAVKKNVTQMAKMFITGESPRDALPVLKKAREKKLAFTADLLGEATLSETEAVEYQRRYIELLEGLAEDAKTWPEVPQIDTDENGPIPRVNISVKVTAIYSQIDEAAWDASKEKVKERLRPIFTKAMECGVFINLDMEQYAHKDFILETFVELINEPAFKAYSHWGVVIQAYLRDALADSKKLVEAAKKRGTPFTVRLVKGAYWDFETIYAKQKGWPIPVYLQKKESDASFEDCSKVFIDAYPNIRLAVGSHNIRSIAAALSYAESKKLDKRAVEVQMLYGMAEPIKRALVKDGIRLREYATIGELIPGMAYLVRRLLENTSNESFLRSKFADNISTDTLLKDPREALKPSSPTPPMQEFNNEPPLDFALPENRKRMNDALAAWRKEMGRTYPIVIGKKEYKTERLIIRENPSQKTEILGRICAASLKEAELAVTTAKEASKTWAKTKPEERAKLVDKLADLIHQNKFRLAALEVLEVGKNWHEADGDIGETIDFCRYYALEMKKLGQPRKMGHAPGEASFFQYQPRGVSLVIAPWNFPLAILTGMVAASLVTGNTVIMKPAEQSSLVAFELQRLATEAGFPAGVLTYLPGYGEDIGDYLVEHKDVHMIAFTGSKEVGLGILRKGSVVGPGQQHVKRIIAEMGGKNAIIVDSDADLDEAVAGLLYSAFGFQGQKCSACSRAIVLEPIYDRFLERLTEAAKSLQVGPSENPRSFVGPVVDNEAYTRILKAIENAKSEAKLVYQGTAPTDGYYIAPTIFADVDPNSNLAQKEIFGPVLGVIKAKDLDDALKIANSTEFALTGGFYSRSPANIEKVRDGFECGNLYINRGCTGALVERHPFGGFKLSGVGSKTGGPGYLEQFMEPRVVTENTMRRGFAPAEDDIPLV
jgi:RHH-type transcriptional regulator, proline utilization regulon repressor / proline dehydrogenase / delta 1-pyrroline-5-carboxylate dehydrogenase